MTDLQNITLGNLGVLDFTSDLCKKVANIEGAFCEAGVAYGGQLINMHKADPTRKIYAFDSFLGIAQHSDKDIEFTEAHGKGTGNPRESNGVTSVPMDICKANIIRLGCDIDKFVFIEGWFIDTLPQLTDEKFAIVRLDCDVYESYVTCLQYLYPRLSVGGYLIIDDWQLSGCKTALMEYFGEEKYKAFVEDTFLGNAYLEKKK
jgi:O-methyltransferase